MLLTASVAPSTVFGMSVTANTGENKGTPYLYSLNSSGNVPRNRRNRISFLFFSGLNANPLSRLAFGVHGEKGVIRASGEHTLILSAGHKNRKGVFL
jgi:hypothetical protein